MKKDLGRINGKTQLIGLFATPIGHSLSPAMHNLAFKKLGLNYAYLAFEVGNEQLEDVVTGMRALNVRGFNVSMPNKMNILPYLDELADSAKFTGAVNTVVNENGRLIGHSTDGMGYPIPSVECPISLPFSLTTVFTAPVNFAESASSSR